MNLTDCVRVKERECHTACFLYAEWVVLLCCVFFFFLAYTNDWGQKFGLGGTCRDSIMRTTATRNHSGQTNSLQLLECAGLYTEVTSLTVRTWSTFTCHRSLMIMIMIKRKYLGRLPTLAHCACAAAAYQPTSHCRKPFSQQLLDSKLDHSSGSSARFFFFLSFFVQLLSSCMKTEGTDEWEDDLTYRIVQLFELSCFAH